MLPRHDAPVFLHLGLGEGNQLAFECAHRRDTRVAPFGRQALAVGDDHHAEARAGGENALDAWGGFAAQQFEAVIR